MLRSLKTGKRSREPPANTSAEMVEAWKGVFNAPPPQAYRLRSWSTKAELALLEHADAAAGVPSVTVEEAQAAVAGCGLRQHRPISLLPIVYKLVEKPVLLRLQPSQGRWVTERAGAEAPATTVTSPSATGAASTSW